VRKWILQSGSLSALVFAATLFSSTHQAAAERYLFDMLFNNNRSQDRAVQPSPNGAAGQNSAPRAGRHERPVVRRPLPQVSAPSFYSFKPDPLVKVDFAAISSVLRNPAGEAVDTRFTEALDGLSDFDLRAEERIAAALVQYYAQSPRFIWVDENGPNKRADEILDVLADADAFGLSHIDYAIRAPIAVQPQAPSSSARMKALIRFEMTLSARALRYARDARLGRLDPNKLSGYHDFKRKPLDEKLVLEILASSAEPATYLQSLHPQNELFNALRDELKKLRTEAEQEKEEIVIAPDILVRPGASHPDFSKVLLAIESKADDDFRAEHGAVLTAHLGSQTYAEELIPIIKAVQRQHKLSPDGIVGQRTVRALTGESASSRIEKVLLSMERLRWQPSYLGSARVMINVPSFTASYFENGTEKLSMRAVVGQSSSQTYFFHDEIEYVEFNPYWGVPRSIIVNEMLPKLRRDPGYLDRAGYEVFDSRGRRVASSAINWAVYGANVPYGVRQPPGASNALGRLKIMFPNSHDIYMHDTPQKSLFARDSRAFSHGCVRLEDPGAMAAAVLGISSEEVAAEINKGRNMRRNVPSKIPVYVGYFTAWPETSGSISYHADIYERDAHLKKALSRIEEVRTEGADPVLAAQNGDLQQSHSLDIQAAEQHVR
jgi:murein L,D-transpeptidase YcbB/YkuD